MQAGQNTDDIPGVSYAGDYDDRTCLHLAASCGKIAVVQYLIDVDGINMDPIDRFGGTPLDDAYRWEPLTILCPDEYSCNDPLRGAGVVPTLSASPSRVVTCAASFIGFRV